ncbi:replication protein, partial [Salmonella enterica subsp. enterica serovar Kentucky]|nr:replication protein [Salmonella enterica subsp. enterica serovar Kentucky]
HFSYNTQNQPPEKPRTSAELKPQSPSLITEKRPRPGPSGRNRVAFNYECCNYTPSWLSVFSLKVLSTRS